MQVKIFSDGGARGNPGPAASGVVIKNMAGENLAAFGKYLGEQTNNYAEYMGLILGLTRALELGATEVECVLDSELVTKQMKREYRVKEPGLQKLYLQAYNLTTKFKKVKFTHIMRAGNKEADKLVNEALDKR
ncbi:MAG: ribonuclease HI family protein [Candidatus Magasanikbacteria bacterium]|jgi:ribonuclease HI